MSPPAGRGPSGVHPRRAAPSLGANDGVAKIWDLATGEVVGSFEGHGAALRNPIGEITTADVPAVFFVRAATLAALKG
jgi:hypothetical protein